MDTIGIAAQIEVACRELGLDDSTVQQTLQQAAAGGGADSHAAAILAQANERLRSEIRQLTTENDAFKQREQKIMELIGAESPEKILHDLRNVLNELMLLKAITKS